jgi:serine/threonine protein kinase
MSIFRKGEIITDFYSIYEQLGEGSFSIVKEAVNRSTGERVALKIIKKSMLGTEEAGSLENEIMILSQIDHPNIVKCREVFEDPEHIYIVLDLLSGGELFQRILDQRVFTEVNAADILRPVIDAIRYCHDLDVAHRDLKLENILYENSEEGAMIKITDFSLAKIIPDDVFAITAWGTPGYVAPEILEGCGYGKEVDYWSIGVILYTLLWGLPPFIEDQNADLFEKIKTADYWFPSPDWDHVSDLAKDLISKLLVLDPDKRLIADEILEHPWMVESGKDNEGSDDSDLNDEMQNLDISNTGSQEVN